MYTLRQLGKCDVPKLCKVAHILNSCGKDMAEKYDLHHWDNSYFKSFIIVVLCSLKNDVFLLYDNGRQVATFMTNQSGEALHFEKLGTLPTESGKGIGSLCMDKIGEIAKASGCKKVCMEVYEHSKNAIRFYEHRGYKSVGTTETLKYKEIGMEKDI